MKLSERLLWNTADRHVLECAGFPLQRIEEFDDAFLRIDESLTIRIYTLAETIQLEQADYSQIILPKAFLLVLKDIIDMQYIDISSFAKNTLWTLASNYLWNSCHNTLSEIKNEQRFKDPELGEFFKLLDEAKTNGLFDGKGFLE